MLTLTLTAICLIAAFIVVYRTSSFLALQERKKQAVLDTIKETPWHPPLPERRDRAASLKSAQRKKWQDENDGIRPAPINAGRLGSTGYTRPPALDTKSEQYLRELATQSQGVAFPPGAWRGALPPMDKPRLRAEWFADRAIANGHAQPTERAALISSYLRAKAIDYEMNSGIYGEFTPVHDTGEWVNVHDNVEPAHHRNSPNCTCPACSIPVPPFVKIGAEPVGQYAPGTVVHSSIFADVRWLLNLKVVEPATEGESHE